MRMLHVCYYTHYCIVSQIIECYANSEHYECTSRIYYIVTCKYVYVYIYIHTHEAFHPDAQVANAELLFYKKDVAAFQALEALADKPEQCKQVQRISPNIIIKWQCSFLCRLFLNKPSQL